ncbi:MAG: hypothetical protein QOH71_988 [Blastocatellia bacterium]|jgi:hypothetical protein|nr:hypothetical protein [Blastocatellia bacterium]
MRNVFIAVGGSGTKVAEALVRLLAIGFPTHRENNILTSAGHSLQIWRLDPDLNSGAAVSLGNCLKDYQELQGLLNGGQHGAGVASSRWAMDIDTRVRHLDPLQLPQAASSDNVVKNLGGILDSRYGTIKSSLPFLAPFYEKKDLEVEIDRGFYQKPFIGAAVMAVFAESLRDENSPGGKACSLTAFQNVSTNFFLCGSLHGGTGACGVPVMGRYLGSLKRNNQTWDWRVGACLLTPYCVPPQPPFGALREGYPTPQQIDDLAKEHGDKPAFKGLPIEDKRKLVEQILLGFYAEPEAMEARARQGLAYYRDHSADYFDELYLAGKPEPDKLKVWSNGGKSQSNPLNSAEVVAALGALNFFSRAGTGNPESYVIGASTPDLDSEKMSLRHLPRYTVGEDEIEPEAVFLSAAVMHHLVTHQIPWEIPAHGWPKEIKRMREVYQDNESRKIDDWKRFSGAAALLAKFLDTTIDPNPEHTVGWNGEDAFKIRPYLSNDPHSLKEITAKTAKKLMSKEAKGELELGNSSIRVSTFEFGDWCPDTADFTRGEYLRLVWSKLFARAQKRLRAEGATF